MLIELSGWLGMILILLAYYLVSAKKTSGDAQNYQLLNLFGAIGIVINTYSKQAWPAMTLNIVWALIALKTLMIKK